MRIIIEDVPDDLARELVQILGRQGAVDVQVEPEVAEWTADRAVTLLRDIPSAARQILRLTAGGDGWADAAAVRGDGDATLRGRTSPITQAIKRGVRAGLLPAGLPAPIVTRYDPDNPSWNRTSGFAMSEALVPVFRAAFARLDAE